MAKKSKNDSGTIGKGVQYEVDGNTLTITVDLSKDFGDSKSGKTTIIASTEGNKTIADVKVGLNIYRYKEKK